MKSIKWLIPILIVASIFSTSCSNTETDEDLNLYNKIDKVADGDSGVDPINQLPPPPPPSDDNN